MAKSKDNDYGLLSCSDRESFVKDCTYQNWEHAKDIFNENPMDLIEKFNFTIAEPPLPKQLKDGSVLKRTSLLHQLRPKKVLLDRPCFWSYMAFRFQKKGRLHSWQVSESAQSQVCEERNV